MYWIQQLVRRVVQHDGKGPPELKPGSLATVSDELSPRADPSPAAFMRLSGSLIFRNQLTVLLSADSGEAHALPSQPLERCI